MMYEIFNRRKRRPLGVFVRPYYERQYGETLENYRKFLAYASLEPSRRNSKNAWKVWATETYGSVEDAIKVKKSKRVSFEGFADTGRHWRWNERAIVMDIAKTRLSQQIWISRDLQRREEDWDAASKLRMKALAALEKLDAEDLSPSIIGQYIELASVLQQKAVPHMQLTEVEAQKILNGLPAERRSRIVRILMAEFKEK